jgi:hypothetical protein
VALLGKDPGEPAYLHGYSVVLSDEDRPVAAAFDPFG